jgi:hypothetical protein
MKKLYYVIAGLFLYSGLLAQNLLAPVPYQTLRETLQQQNRYTQQNPDGSRATVYRRIADRHERYDNPSSTWYNVDSNLYTYNTDALKTNQASFLSNTGGWYNNNRQTLVYNGAGLTAEIVLEGWINHLNVFRNTYHYTYTYNTAGKLLEEVVQVWDTTNNNWQNANRYVTTLNAQNLITDYLSQQWNTGTNNWLNVSRYTAYSYNANGKLLEYISQNWVAGWQNQDKYIYTRNGQDQTTSYTEQSWIAGAWNNYSKVEYLYDIYGDNTQTYSSIWSGGAWQPLAQNQTTYNSAHKETLKLVYQWDGANYNYYARYERDYNANQDQIRYEYLLWNGSGWTPNNRYTNNYDSNNNNIYQFTELYNTGTTLYEPRDRWYYFYDAFTVSGINEPKNELSASLYPNPAANTPVTITFNTQAPAEILINVYSLQGSLLLQQTVNVGLGTNNTQIPVQNLAAGTYYVQVVDATNKKVSTLTLANQ